MKNVLSYYYNLHLNDIHQNNGIYKFNINGSSYAFLLYDRELNELDDLYNLSIELFKNGILSHQFIPNKDNQLLTYVNQKPFVLLQLYISDKKNITIDDIKKFTRFVPDTSKKEKLKRDAWSDLWANKMDYFEYQVSQFGKKNPIIRESFGYFEGLVENGISLFNQIGLKSLELSVCHRRIRTTDTMFDFYNPLNFIIDYKVRDACEYFKEKFKNNQNIMTKLIDYLSDKYLNIYEIILFYTRFFYPSFYFDKFEYILNNELDDYELMDSVNLINKYENLLKQIYLFLSKYIMMPDIEWIKKT